MKKLLLLLTFFISLTVFSQSPKNQYNITKTTYFYDVNDKLGKPLYTKGRVLFKIENNSKMIYVVNDNLEETLIFKLGEIMGDPEYKDGYTTITYKCSQFDGTTYVIGFTFTTILKELKLLGLSDGSFIIIYELLPIIESPKSLNNE